MEMTWGFAFFVLAIFVAAGVIFGSRLADTGWVFVGVGLMVLLLFLYAFVIPPDYHYQSW